MKDILRRLLEGEISADEAEREILERFRGEVEGTAVLDLLRDFRTAVPEVVLGEGKDPEDVKAICTHFLRTRGEVAATRIDPDMADYLRRTLEKEFEREGENLHVDYNPRGRVLTARLGDQKREKLGEALLVTAGTSDIPVAEEARALLEFFGVSVRKFYDVGVAGLHRLKPVLDAERSGNYRVALVFAGREGALPTVLSALISIPVIGVPVSSGYGHGGGGEAALSTMLQSCSPIAVVNIDSGFTAAMVAIKILKSVAGGKH